MFCDGIAFHPGEGRNLPVATRYGNWSAGLLGHQVQRNLRASLQGDKVILASWLTLSRLEGLQAKFQLG